MHQYVKTRPPVGAPDNLKASFTTANDISAEAIKVFEQKYGAAIPDTERLNNLYRLSLKFGRLEDERGKTYWPRLAKVLGRYCQRANESPDDESLELLYKSARVLAGSMQNAMLYFGFLDDEEKDVFEKRLGPLLRFIDHYEETHEPDNRGAPRTSAQDNASPYDPSRNIA